MRFPLLLCIVAGMFLAFPAWGQRLVEGTVVDARSGAPLPGVSIVLKGTMQGTTTDVDGRFSINLPPGPQVLIFSFVGYRTQEVAVGPEVTRLDVRLEEDVLGLEEVVVTGLATSVRRSNLAHAVATVNAAELAEVTAQPTLDAALSGKVTGAYISAYSGAPGGGLSIKLRGISTINGNAQPLFVVDGVLIDNSQIQSGVDAVTNATGGGSGVAQDNPVNRIADLNPEDIESIEILKGASAAALYGARASNGVVIIRTKRGRPGQTVVRVRQEIGFNEIARRLGTRTFTAETALAFFGPKGLEEFQAALNGRGFYDYEDLLYGNRGLLYRTSLSISGGNERTQFFASGLLHNEEGIVKRTGYDKYSLRLNLNHRLTDRIQLETTTNYIRAATRRGLTGNDNSGTTFGISLAATPNFVYLLPDENGIYPDHPFNSANPLQTAALMKNEESVNRFIGSGRLRVNLLQRARQALQFILEGGVDYYNLENDARFPVELQFERLNVDGRGPGTLILRQANTFNTNWRALFVHTWTPGTLDLTLTSQGGLTGANFDQNQLLFVADGLVPGQQNLDQASTIDREQTRQFQRDRSFFFQEEANWADRLILTVGLRGDKSSINGDVRRFFLYPKASVALNLHQFNFWRWPVIDQLKLRLAWGQTGNIAGFGIKYTSFDPTVIGGQAGSIISRRRGFDRVKPERQTELEGGFDLSLFHGRAALEFTLYRKVITDLLLQREVEPSTGFGLETFNGGELENVGLEVGLSLVPVDRPGLRWISQIRFWTNRATVTRLPVPPFRALGGGFGATLGEIRIEEGQSPTQIVGIDDIDGDGRPDGVFKLGDVAPKFQLSFSNEWSIASRLTLSVLAHWKYGGDNLNLTMLLFDLFGTTADFDRDDDGDGIPNGIERVNLLGVSARPFVQNASYFRIREIGLYYDVPLERLWPTLHRTVRRLRVGLSARNPITITPYKSYDPEVNNFGTQPVADGVEVTPYPAYRTFLFYLGFEL